MRVTKRQLKAIVKEAHLYAINEFGKNWEKEAQKLADEEGQEADAQLGDEIRTIGDLKKLIKQAQMKKRGEQVAGEIKGALKDALVDEILGKIPFAGTAKSLFDFAKSAYDLPDESRTGTALDYLDVDDDVAKIVDDPIENAFLAAFGKELDNMPDDRELEDLDMTKNLSKYLGNEFNKRTVAGFSEGRKVTVTRSQLKSIVREAFLKEQPTKA